MKRRERSHKGAEHTWPVNWNQNSTTVFYKKVVLVFLLVSLRFGMILLSYQIGNRVRKLEIELWSMSPKTEFSGESAS